MLPKMHKITQNSLLKKHGIFCLTFSCRNVFSKGVDTGRAVWYPNKCLIRRCGGMVDTGDLKSPGSNAVPVRVRSPAPPGTVQYRGVEQLVARRAHNPEVGGSSPPSATILSDQNRYTHLKPLRNQGFQRFYALFFQSVFYRYARAFQSVRQDLN